MRLLIVAVALLGAVPVAMSEEPASGIQTDLVGMFRSYMKDLRVPATKRAFQHCDEDLHCLAQYFSRDYLATFAQKISDYLAEGSSLANTQDPLKFGLSIAQVHEYAAATTAPRRAVLTMIATDTAGNCMPLIRFAYHEELGFWRIDHIEQDVSTPQRCTGAKVIDSFPAPAR